MNYGGIHKSNGVLIREIKDNEFDIASKITYSCKGQSRGYDGESVKDLMEWHEGEYSKLFVAIFDDELVGIMLTGLYGFDNKDKVTLWIRLLAVDPKHQRKGIGQSLLSFGLDWGIKNKAKRSCLHADVYNDGAINMYRRNGYNMNEGRGQINMLLSR